MKNSLIILGIILIVAVAGVFAYKATAPKGATQVPGSRNSFLSVRDQRPGVSVTVSSVNLKEWGFVAVRKDEGGVPGKIIGVSIPLSPGENQNISINLTEETRDGQVVYVLAHMDGNNDRLFEFPGPDIPLNADAGTRVNIAGSLSKEQPVTKDASANNIVAYHNDGFFPKSIEIKAGQYVTFQNVSDFDMWVASDPHPSHGGLLGFDELTSVKDSGKYSYVFTQTGTWKYHNDMDISKKGEVVVK